MPEYEARVWDMAKHVLHPAALYVTAAVLGGLRLLGHPLAESPGTGTLLELAFFLAAFFGAWACFYSTLLRDAGLASATVTFLVPLAWVAAAACWFAASDVTSLSPAEWKLLATALFAPGPLGWIVTIVRWRSHRRAQAAILGEASS